MRLVAFIFAALLFALPARAEKQEISIVGQYGISYLPVMLMEHEKVVEKWTAATAQGWLFAKDNLKEAAEAVVKLQPTLKAEDIEDQGKVLLDYSFNDDTTADGWGTMKKETWQSQLDMWDQLKQFKGAAPKLEDITTFDVLDATKDARKA